MDNLSRKFFDFMYFHLFAYFEWKKKIIKINFGHVKVLKITKYERMFFFYF